MNKVLASIILISIVAGIVYSLFNSPKSFKNPILKNISSRYSENKKINSQTSKQEYAFVPYWTFEEKLSADSEYSLIYFGLGVNEKGIEKNDKGFKQLKTFANLTLSPKEKVLAIRMTDASVNAEILKDSRLKEEIATEATALAKENNFDALLLDYETSAFAFESTVKNISDFYALFAGKVKNSNLKFYVTLFGDNYFRTRAFDVRKIGELSDKVFIMTYDFHKSRGNPGPNFPLIDNGVYGYDLSKMVDDFQKDVDNKKLVVVLGYFGYDWRVDKNKKAASSGIPLSKNEIKKDFIDGCEYKNCSLVRDSETQEPSIVYVDDSNNSHVIWFEDEVSIGKKIEFLKSRGILEIGYWAYSYY